MAKNPNQISVQSADSASAGNQAILRVDWARSRTGAADNGTTEFLKYEGGTVVARIATGGKFRPLGYVNPPVVSSANSWTMTNGAADAVNFFVGDTVDFTQADGTSIATGRTITALNKSTGAVTVDGAALTLAVTDLMFNDDVTIDGDGDVGLVCDSQETFSGVDDTGAAVYEDAGLRVMYAGVADPTLCDGLNTLTRALLPSTILLSDQS